MVPPAYAAAGDHVAKNPLSPACTDSRVGNSWRSVTVTKTVGAATES